MKIESGTLVRSERGWRVRYEKKILDFTKWREIPVYKEETLDLLSLEGKEVQFEEIDEFTHPHLFFDIPWGDGISCARIVF
jgi:hypothetical protein